MKEVYKWAEIYLKRNGFNFSDFYSITIRKDNISFQGYLKQEILELKKFVYDDKSVFFEYREKDGKYQINITLTFKN